jgi:hypothetical protein
VQLVGKGLSKYIKNHTKMALEKYFVEGIIKNGGKYMAEWINSYYKSNWIRNLKIE